MAEAMLETSFNACLEDTFEDTEEELVGVEEDEVSEDNEEVIDELESLPDHEFDIKKTVWKTGPKKGQEKIQVSLIIGNHTFRRRREVKGHVTFSCNTCEAEKTFVSAIATVNEGRSPKS